MNCQEMKGLLHAYVDGELDVVHQMACEKHLTDCASCLQAADALRSLRTALSNEALYYKAPAHLQKRLSAALKKESRSRSVRVPAMSLPVLQSGRAIAAVAALLMIGIVGGLLARHSNAFGEAGDSIAQEVLAGHVRSLMANHLEDVVSTNQHTVKPWFNGKLDFAPPVENLEQEGFPLKGGRLDYMNDRTAAALIYQRASHVINVFLWPSKSEDTPTKEITQRGYHLYHWTQAGMSFWAVSDLNTREMQQFVQLLRNHLAGTR